MRHVLVVADLTDSHKPIAVGSRAVSSPITAPPYDHWPRYDELTALVQGWAAARPKLLSVESVGRSHEGREIWLCTATNTATGHAAEKPAVWIDANIHASEVTGGAAALHLIHRLLTGHGVDERVTRALDTRAFYVVPRLGPDGVELALADRPQFVRSGVRHWPRADPQPGLHESDVDGDGRVLTMRIPDETGQWKIDPAYPRLLVPRAIDEDGDGPYYRLLYEGHLVDYDGEIIKVPKPLEGLDFNRNFPYDWAPAGNQDGAGSYPTSEPEVRAAVQAITDRPNITHAVTYHTFGGVHLRPYSAKPDDDYPPADLEVLKRVGAEATRLTGYPAASVFHHFQYEPKTFMRGASTTGCTTPWACSRGRRSSGARSARPVSTSACDSSSGGRATHRGRREDARVVGHRSGRRGVRGLVSVRPPAAGAGRDRRLGLHGRDR